MDDPDPKYGLGLEQGVNRLVEYNSLWPLAFAEEAARIKAALGDRALAIEHYGSTSVPGLRAKPIIDLQIGVADIRDGLRFIEPMAGLGYDYAGDQGIPEHHIFGRGEARTYLAHVVVYEGPQWFRSLRFRDRLRHEPDVRAAYERLKLKLAASAATRGDYTAGKTPFIERICAAG
ncbi:MAG TPA: GrpB family protein [Caulobacteraceae bacterium]|nr:GrpB family protein [Caulobacteraceae bacterium]